MNCDHDKKSSFSTVSTPLQTFELTRCQLGDDRHPFVREPRGRFKLTPQIVQVASRGDRTPPPAP
jgi:hypothetical protein